LLANKLGNQITKTQREKTLFRHQNLSNQLSTALEQIRQLNAQNLDYQRVHVQRQQRDEVRLSPTNEQVSILYVCVGFLSVWVYVFCLFDFVCSRLCFIC